MAFLGERQMKIGCFKIKPLNVMPSFPMNQLDEIRNGGKIELPQLAVERCVRSSVPSPFIFKLVKGDKKVLCSAISFEGPRSQVSVPQWMLEHLGAQVNTNVTIFALTEPIKVGTKVVFQPQSATFLEITDPRAVLERAMRNYACLTPGDLIAFWYNNQVYRLLVHETVPNCTINITDCDLQVDFVPPPGYEEPVKTRTPEKVAPEPEEPVFFDETFSPFLGKSRRLDGKQLTTEQDSVEVLTASNRKRVRGVPDRAYTPGSLKFIRRAIDTSAPSTPKKPEPDSKALPAGPPPPPPSPGNDDDQSKGGAVSSSNSQNVTNNATTPNDATTRMLGSPYTRSMARAARESDEGVDLLPGLDEPLLAELTLSDEDEDMPFDDSPPTKRSRRRR
ncbi:Ubiquitin recognition factor in ER-associated degradation protein 1 [Halotydeus destructor]|nr:Ubiquitin recognition factor in ER-associated degradation protein 1 [Halotydeus destructor]